MLNTKMDEQARLDAEIERIITCPYVPNLKVGYMKDEMTA